MKIWDIDRKPRLLVVEDDADIANMLRIYFEGCGFAIDTALRGSDALRLCSENEYDCLIMDIMLPDMDGFELISLLNLRVRYVPIIFLTQKDERSDKLAGLELGAVDYITKPFDIEELRLRVTNQIKQRAAYLKLIHESAAHAERAKVKILFLAANPKNTSRLRLDEEFRAIDQAILQSAYRDHFDLRQQWAVRIEDLQGHLLRHQPSIIHFSGHGSEGSEVILEDSYGNSQAVSSRALSRLFQVLKGDIRCVVLNACYSEGQANAIAEHIDCVVGMSKAIGDPSAIKFATAFYQALGFGRDVQTAFELGCLQIDMEGLNEQDTPKLLAKKIRPGDIAFVSGA